MKSAARPAMRPVDGAAIAAMAVGCLLEELETWPKPGLVSHVDCGSHVDMDADTFRASAAVLEPYFAALAEAGGRDGDMTELRIIGLEAEAAMLSATAGVNTHRGAIFGMGLLCAAAGTQAGGRIDPHLPLGTVVARLWASDIMGGPVLLHSHGSGARRRFRAGGARVEAATGFPTIYRVGLPALARGAAATGGDAEAARVEACFALIAALEDTNLLHRAGLAGLDFAHRAARDFLDAGGVGAEGWQARARAVHEAFVERRLSPGGSADLLAMTLFVAACEGPP